MATSADSWPTSSDSYLMNQRIGRGAFSTVWKAACPLKGTDVAIKIMDLEGITSSIEDIMQEVLTMRMSSHPNVLACYCSFVSEDKLWLVTQLMDKGSCLRVMNMARNRGMGDGMNEAWVAYVLGQTLHGLKYLHDNGNIHRDIKAGNILLDSLGNIRLADFGVAGWLVAATGRRKNVTTFVGTPCWMAPEVMEQVQGYNEKADIWSLGITGLELAKGYAPYAHFPPMKVLVMTIEDDPPSLRSYDNDRQPNGNPFSKAFEDFVRKCLQKEPSRRPSAETLLAHKFLKNRTGQSLVEDLLSRIDSVGTSDPHDVVRPPGARPATFALENAEGEEKADAETVRSTPDQTRVRVSNAPTGTTWIFDEAGSQEVYRRASTTTERQTVEQSTSEFMDDFEADLAGDT